MPKELLNFILQVQPNKLVFDFFPFNEFKKTIQIFKLSSSFHTFITLANDREKFDIVTQGTDLDVLPFSSIYSFEEKVRFVYQLGYRIASESVSAFSNFHRIFRGKYLHNNITLFIVEPSLKVPPFFVNDLAVSRVPYWEEFRQLDQMMKQREVDVEDRGFFLEYLQNVSHRGCPNIFNLILRMIRGLDSNGVEIDKKRLKAVGIIQSILGSWNKHSREFAAEMSKMFLAFNVPQPVCMTLCSLLSICYYKKLDPAVQKRVQLVLEDSLIVRENEVLHEAVDNHTKTEYYRLPIVLHNMIMHCYRKIPTNIKFDRVYAKNRVRRSDVPVLSFQQILRHSSRGQKYIKTYPLRLKSRSNQLKKKTYEQKVNITPPTIVKSFSTGEIGRFLKEFGSEFTFAKLPEHILRIILAFVYGDFQFYCVLCRKYPVTLSFRHGSIIRVPLSGHLHFEMSGGDSVWKMFRKVMLMDLNVKMNMKCSWTLSSSKYPRYRRLLYVVSLAVIEVLAEFPHAGTGESVNFVVEFLWCFRFFSGLYLALIEAIRTNDHENMVSLWCCFLPIFDICHKTNYRLSDLSQILIHACLTPKVRRYLSKHRFSFLKNRDGCIDDDQLCEICNGIACHIPISVHGVEQWLKTLPLHVYLQMNEKGGLVEYIQKLNANQRKLKKGKKTGLWKFEKQVKDCAELIRDRIIELNDGSTDFSDFHLKSLEKEKLFPDPSSLANKITPKDNPIEYFWTFRHHNKNKNFEKWLDEKMKLFNDTGTVFSAPGQNEHIEDDCNNKAWADYSAQAELAYDEVDEDDEDDYEYVE